MKDELAQGLLQPQPSVAPKFLCDALGSKLFEAITELDEYDPTRTETAIFERHRDELAQACGAGQTLVDLGAGNFADAASLFGALRPGRYVAVDISVDFLRCGRAAAPGGGLLIGVDLLKPPEVLQRACDDALGVTAAFNLNLLRQLNRRLGSDFDVSQWRHVAVFDAARSRVEMHLEARRDLQVRWPGGGLRGARVNA